MAVSTDPSFWQKLLSQAPQMLSAVNNQYGSEDPTMQQISRLSSMFAPKPNFNNAPQQNTMGARPLGGVVGLPQTPQSRMQTLGQGNQANSFWDTYGKFSGLMNLGRPMGGF